MSADVADQRRRPYERKLLRGARAMFRDQRERVEAWLADNRGRFAEAVGPDDFDRVWSTITDATSGPMADLLDDLAPQILERGWADANADVGMGLSFDVGHPRAGDYLRQLGARRVTQIDRETRRQLAKLLADGVDEGWSYDRTARAIRERFDSFSRHRARLVAVTESADAYEHGQWMHRSDLRDRGIDTEVAWLAEAGACVICAPNPDAGYIGHNEAFPSGHHRPPAHPRCRCALATRVAARSRVAARQLQTA